MATTKKVAHEGSSHKKAVSKKAAVSIRPKKTKVTTSTQKQKKSTSTIARKKSAKKVLHKSIKTSAHKKTTTLKKKNIFFLSTIKVPVSLIALTTLRVPMNIDNFAVQTARIGGLVIVTLGAFFTLLYAQYIWSAPTIDDSVLSVQMLGQASRPTATVATSIEQPATFFIDTNEPLTGSVPVKIYVNEADTVDVLVFEKTHSIPIKLGAAKKIQQNVWEYDWDTTKMKAGGSYKVAADVTNIYTIGNPYRVSDTSGYVEVSKEESKKDVKEIEPLGTNDTPRIEMQKKNDEHDKVTPESNIKVPLETVDITEHTDTLDRIDEVELNTTTSTEPIGIQKVPLVPTLLEPPEAFLQVETERPLSGIIKLSIDITEANFIELWVVPAGSKTEKIIALAKRTNPTSHHWEHQWDTSNTPNGEYQIFARVKNSFGLYKSSSKSVKIFNVSFKPEYTDKQKEELNTIDDAKVIEDELIKDEELKKEKIQAVFSTEDKEDDEIKKDTLVQTEVDTEIRTDEFSQDSGVDTEEGQPLEHDINGENQENITGTTTITKKEKVEVEVELVLQDFSQRIEEELHRLTTAYRSKDSRAIKNAEKRIKKLKKEIIASVTGDLRTESLLNSIDTKINKIIDDHKALASKVDTLITQRIGDSVFKDSDSDGITDYDERTLYNTDPYTADSDNDGFIDGAEVAQGYDPLDSKREASITFQSPQNNGVERKDILAVESIVAVISENPTDDTDGVPSQAIISGKALPNSFVTLYIYSTPIIVTVKTEADGSWKYRFDKELENGEHKIYVGVTDNAGRIVAKSPAFTFVKEAQAFTPTDAITSGSISNEQTENSLLSTYMIYLILSISVVSIGLVLILLGLHLDTRQRRFKGVINTEDES